jgi:uncharacterized protein (UPF0212 family)
MAAQTVTAFPVKAARELKGSVHCPLCTHTVPAQVLSSAKGSRVLPGQKCPRCSSSLDAAFVLRIERAA